MIESFGGALEAVGKEMSEKIPSSLERLESSIDAKQPEGVKSERNPSFLEKLESSIDTKQSESAKEAETKDFRKGVESCTQDGGQAEKSGVENAETEKKLEQTVDEYVENLKNHSECPETIPDRPFEASDLEKLPPEEVAKRREEFSEVKPELKKQWEEAHGIPWPKYEHDVYSANGKLIRKAGSDYDAHHIQPLGMGGKNEVKNITPLNAEVHYDKQGVHSPDSPYTRLDKMLGGADS